MRVIDTITLVPTRYGDTDVWISQSQYYTGPGRWQELRMHCKYTRRQERLSVLYTGPDGETRVKDHGSQIPGPHGSLIAQASVISANPVARAEYIDVEEGDVLILNGQRMVIADDRSMDYPHLITEAEWGLVVARRAVGDYITELQREKESTDPEAAARVNTLHALSSRLLGCADELRARYQPGIKGATAEELLDEADRSTAHARAATERARAIIDAETTEE